MQNETSSVTDDPRVLDSSSDEGGGSSTASTAHLAAVDAAISPCSVFLGNDDDTPRLLSLNESQTFVEGRDVEAVPGKVEQSSISMVSQSIAATSGDGEDDAPPPGPNQGDGAEPDDLEESVSSITGPVPLSELETYAEDLGSDPLFSIKRSLSVIRQIPWLKERLVTLPSFRCEDPERSWTLKALASAIKTPSVLKSISTEEKLTDEQADLLRIFIRALDPGCFVKSPLFADAEYTKGMWQLFLDTFNASGPEQQAMLNDCVWNGVRSSIPNWTSDPEFYTAGHLDTVRIFSFQVFKRSLNKERWQDILAQIQKEPGGNEALVIVNVSFFGIEEANRIIIPRFLSNGAILYTDSRFKTGDAYCITLAYGKSSEWFGRPLGLVAKWRRTTMCNWMIVFIHVLLILYIMIECVFVYGLPAIPLPLLFATFPGLYTILYLARLWCQAVHITKAKFILFLIVGYLNFIPIIVLIVWLSTMDAKVEAPSLNNYFDAAVAVVYGIYHAVEPFLLRFTKFARFFYYELPTTTNKRQN